MKNVWSLLSLFVLSMLSGVLRVHGQASLNDASFRTEGDITYAVLNCSVDACYSLSPQRLTRSGHQIDQALATARADFCVCDITFPCPAHNELATCPPILVLTGRPDDAWLASWSRAEAAVPHPLDPIVLGRTALGLLRTPAR